MGVSLGECGWWIGRTRGLFLFGEVGRFGHDVDLGNSDHVHLASLDLPVSAQPPLVPLVVQFNKGCLGWLACLPPVDRAPQGFRLAKIVARAYGHTTARFEI